MAFIDHQGRTAVGRLQRAVPTPGPSSDSATTPAARHTPHDNFLDGLRGLAILIVVAAHGPVIPMEMPLFGQSGVFLFFVLSAFLLSRQLYNSGLTPATLTRYFVARVFRIYPVFIPVLAYEVLVGFDFTHPIPPDLAWRMLTLREGYFVYWTIVVEFQYYFVLPVVVWLFVLIGVKCWRVSLILAGIVLTLSLMRAGNFDPAIANNVWLFLPCFLFGTIAGLWAANAERISLPVYAPLLALLGIWLSLPTGFEMIWRQFTAAPLPLDWFPYVFHPIQGFLWTIVLLGCFHPFWRTIFENPVLRFFGEISYSLYLFHQITWNWVLSAGRLMPAGSFEGDTMTFLYVAVPTLLACWSHRFVEMPTIALGKRIGNWLTGNGFGRALPAGVAQAPSGIATARARRLALAADPAVPADAVAPRPASR
jgi:peptidoglycan/LPS O-acetylase OafA/YrhL